MGSTPGLSDADLRRLEGLLAQGAKAHGWHNEPWTAARVARLIEHHFHLDYHPEHVRKILKQRLGWTSQKPRRTARERNDKEVARWLGDEFPRIVREAFAPRADLVFLDESGFFLTPTLRRTLAPRGKAPVLVTRTRRDKWSAISCITLSPLLARPACTSSCSTMPSVAWTWSGSWPASVGAWALRVVWDRNQIHSKSKVVQRWLTAQPEVVAEDFPGYVPDLNPDEGVWGWAKYGRLANLTPHDKKELHDHVIEQLTTAKRRPDLLRGFIQQTGLPGVTHPA